MGVFLDVVWNHVDQNNILSVFDGWSQKEAGFPANGGAPQGIYFYQNQDAVTEWGPRPNYAQPAVRDYILHSIAMLLIECRVSGFRWDSTICIRKVCCSSPLVQCRSK
jgi:1,4-alpha-glucan branching enzyme